MNAMTPKLRFSKKMEKQAADLVRAATRDYEVARQSEEEILEGLSSLGRRN